MDISTLRPLGKLVLIKADAPEEKIGMIVVPKTAGRHSGCVGEVVATGHEVEHLAAGMRVVFASMFDNDCAPRFEHDGRHWYVIPEEQIHGVIENG